MQKMRGLAERAKTLFRGRRGIALTAIFSLQVVLQVVGAACYSLFPDWLWAICDALILVTPLLLGPVPGVICCLPNLVAEILWLAVKGYLGAFLHGIAFMLTVLALGAAGQAVGRRCVTKAARCVSGAVLFEAGLIFENLLYCLLRAVFIASAASPVTASAVLKTTLSVGNPVCLALLLLVSLAERPSP